jgi:hypothetical protein
MRMKPRDAVFLLFALAALAAQREPRTVPPDYERKMAAIKNFEAGVVPLFVVGDLNEDGNVDDADLALLRQYLEKKTPAAAVADITCMGAADLNRNGRVDARDLEILSDILKHGRVNAPALAHGSRLSCDYRNFMVAAGPEAVAGGAVPIHFLDAAITPRNSTARISAGDATVGPIADGFLVRVAQSARPGSTITVSLTLAGNRKYLYTFAVIPAPGQRP